MTRTLLRRLRDDDGGWALVVALVLMTIMIGTQRAIQPANEIFTPACCRKR